MSANTNRDKTGDFDIPHIFLNDGHSIPQLGFGSWQVNEAQAPEVIGAALSAGYRLIDTANAYANEAGVGRALQQSSVPRAELYVTTKLWVDSHGYDRTLRAFDASAQALGLDVIDLYLVHWPCPERHAYVDTWRALIELRKQGRVKSIGVSNFNVDHLERIIGETGVVPAINQVELHPGFQQRELREFHAKYGIATQAWSPIGQGRCLSVPMIKAVAARHNRTPAQIVLRWHIENGLLAIPKSSSHDRMSENIDVFRFSLTPEDHALIEGLDRVDGRLGPHPNEFGHPRLLRRLFDRCLSLGAALRVLVGGVATALMYAEGC